MRAIPPTWVIAAGHATALPCKEVQFRGRLCSAFPSTFLGAFHVNENEAVRTSGGHPRRRAGRAGDVQWRRAAGPHPPPTRRRSWSTHVTRPDPTLNRAHSQHGTTTPLGV